MFQLVNKNHIYKQLVSKAINKVGNIQSNKIHKEGKCHLTGNHSSFPQKNLWKLMLLEEQTAGRKPDPQSLGLIWCFCNVIPHTRESTQSTTALWHSWLLCSCLTLSAPCNLQKHWTLLSALSLQSTSQAPLTWEPCPSWYHALTEVYNYHCTPWGKHQHTLTKDYCISQKS